MKRLILTSLFLVCTCLALYAQKKKPQAKDLELTYEVLKAELQTSNKKQVLLSLKNHGNVAFPASGWNIYFNGRVLNTSGASAQVAKIELVNGDLFRLVPLAGFKSLAAGATVKLQLSAQSLQNITEIANGFYLVWNDTPAKAENIDRVKVIPNFDIKHELNVAAKIYTQNEGITDIKKESLPSVFPSPSSYLKRDGVFRLTADVNIVTNADFEPEAKGFATELTKILGKRPAIVSEASGQAVVFEKGGSNVPESYEIKITPHRILIVAGDRAGAFYAVQSIKSMFPPVAWASVQKEISIPAAEIKDAPRFGFRGFMMDVARNFQPKSEVLKVLDLMGLYKLNVFHFHLTEDEGWRLEIPGLPELTAVGSQRGHSLGEQQSILPSYGSGGLAKNNAVNGFFTRAEYIEILKYATERHILVIPEIETPGHARAAIKSMDARYHRLIKAGQKAEAEKYLLRDLDDKSVYRSVQGFNDNVINVALPSAYTFLEKVVDEIVAMHKEAGAPLKTIHFGGDEVPGGVWEKSPAVDKLEKSNPEVKGPDELWYYYFTKINNLLKARNLYLSGWEEIGLHKALVNGEKKMVPEPRFLGQNFHADVWNNLTGNEDLAYKMANAGYKVVLTPVTNFYIDLAVDASFAERGQNWGGYVGVDKPFYFIPYDYYKNVKEDERGNPVSLATFADKARLTEEGKKNIVGLQAPLWSEAIKTPAHFEYMFLPKILGLAERAWAKDPEWATEKDVQKSEALYNIAWSEFVNVLAKKELPRLDHYAGGFKYRIPTAGLKVDANQIEANVQLPGFVIRYTLDGTDPVASSPVYTKPIPAKGKVKLRVFDATGRGGRTVLAH